MSRCAVSAAEKRDYEAVRLACQVGVVRRGGRKDLTAQTANLAPLPHARPGQQAFGFTALRRLHRG